jgi:glycosyltransferase involved in cell wall biosynthesis
MTGHEYSAIIVVGNRHDDVRELFLSYWQDLGKLETAFEVIYVLDGPFPGAREELERLQGEGYDFRIIQLARSFGEATALVCGFENATGRRILTLPAYYQIEPGQLPALVEATDSAEMVIARRWPRRGSALEHFRRNAFHGLLRWITGYEFRDLGCGVRLFDRRILEEIGIYGDQHRFLPALAHNSGFKVKEVDLRQSPRDEFKGRYRWREYLHRILDIFTVFFLVRFTKKPLRFFGMIGSGLLGIGALFLLVIVFQRLFLHWPTVPRCCSARYWSCSVYR